MNTYSIFFHTYDDIKYCGLSKCISVLRTPSVFSAGDVITDRNGHEFLITEINHFIEWADDDAEHCIYVNCVSKTLTQKDAESLEDWS